MDRTINGQRVVLSAVFADLQRTGLDDIQERLQVLKTGDPAELADFAGARLLHRLPIPLGSMLFRLGIRPFGRRASALGTFAVSSLGHRSIDGFHAIGGTTITFGLGQVADRPVVRDGAVVVAPVLRLNMSFDHRMIDGAEAADVLAEVKAALEGFSEKGIQELDREIPAI
ncbi:2-oxo acid dehydrogenase subunit E2 [Nocardia amikacinitolerans]|uniref:2-oxo acid dehydrogenase subunit E2 n=1 Tax=Nocardia amikacinitolerans TaxID=756689 RepID=UPI0014719817|nr:2-oxo acid dehydrogenase subunit E2 [Nocardia amikacinitolerans]